MIANKKWLCKVIGLLAIAALSSCDLAPAISQKNDADNQQPAVSIYESMHNGWIWLVDKNNNKIVYSAWNYGLGDNDVAKQVVIKNCDANSPESVCFEDWPVPIVYQGSTHNKAKRQKPLRVSLPSRAAVYFKIGNTDCVRMKSQWETPETSGENGLWLTYAVFCNGKGYTTLSIAQVMNEDGDLIQSTQESDTFILVEGRGLRSECRIVVPKFKSSEGPPSKIEFIC